MIDGMPVIDACPPDNLLEESEKTSHGTYVTRMAPGANHEALGLGSRIPRELYERRWPALVGPPGSDASHEARVSLRGTRCRNAGVPTCAVLGSGHRSERCETSDRAGVGRYLRGIASGE